jgi:hypothetical protein
MINRFDWKQYGYSNAYYYIAYTVGLIFLVAFYTLDYAVDIDKGELLYRDNIVASNEAGLFKMIKHTWIGGKLFKIYSTKREKEIVFRESQDGNGIKIKNIFTEEYPELSAHDLGKETKYIRVIKESLSSNRLPFHVANLSKIFQASNDRFFSSPIWPFSPQILLLYILTPMSFIFINHLLLYTIGAYGLIKLSKEHGLKYPAFLLIFLIFNFNGHIIEKFAVYGSGQLGYYFIPLMLLFFLRLMPSDVDNRQSKAYYVNSIYLGIAFALILLQGSFHIYVQFVTFIIIWTFFNLSKLKYAVISLTISFLINAVRIIPAALSFGVGSNKEKAFGYYDPVMLFKAVMYPTTHLTYPPFHWWEVSVFISIFGFLILLKYSILDPLIDQKGPGRQFNYKIYAPIIIMILLSMWKVKHYLVPDFIPLINSESVATRYAIVPLVFLTVIASFNLSRSLSIMSSWRKALIYLLLGLLLVSLLDHLLQWRLLKVQTEVDWLFLNLDAELVPGFDLKLERAGIESIMNANLHIINRDSDFLYKVSFYFGLIISLVSIFLTVFLLRKAKVRGVVAHNATT